MTKCYEEQKQNQYRYINIIVSRGWYTIKCYTYYYINMKPYINADLSCEVYNNKIKIFVPCSGDAVYAIPLFLFSRLASNSMDNIFCAIFF